ncbi:hypothetical protein [Nitrospirillum amazonense]|uniref:hypothetical protein n=1 Tax=Nitrospirillum amazonense TaxID=28077 RepID=UPI0024125B9C|nr:hypothetical protein [Nitrospirillum amazonense]MDG3442442.1 hypothetical protein [Nitrospirillum amazonense]
MDDTPNIATSPDTVPLAGTGAPASPAPADTPSPDVASEPTVPLEVRVDAAIAAWLAADIHNSPIARATEAYNHLITVLPALRDRIVAPSSET